MKRNLRFYFALFFAKGTALVLKLIRRKGTSMPGSWAIILCPDFLGRMPRPKTVIGITGTNGKTTVANMVEDVLADQGYDFVCNRSGTNVNTGVASSLIANSTFFGKPKKDLAVFELDERSSPKILPYLKPDLLLCTNIFRDSFKRNAHMEFIVDILNRYIPQSTRLVLNADDLLCSGIGEKNPRVTFGIDRLPTDKTECHNIVRDVTVCPVCGTKLEWDLVRYHHIGKAHCPACGFRSPEADYRMTSMDGEAHKMTVLSGGEEHIYPLPNETTINVYNSLSAIALLSEFGLSPEQISASMDKLSISETRYSEEEVGGKKVILHLAKGQNPIACSRAFENIRDYPGKKAVILFLDDYFDAAHTVENTAWLYDTDFEFLNDENIVQIICAGARHWDVTLRLLLADIPKEKIAHLRENEQAAAHLSMEEADSVFILYDVYTIGLANHVKEQVKELLGGQKA
ncbi:MAG: DUF1727 domain-containing protein [Acutalibacter sp.]|nr:DUF1727 domain-containing protein [Acutalibacter sp.]